MTYILHIGNKRYSSWSLRGWLLLEAFGLPFEERLTPMFTEAFEALKAQIAPGRQVPTLEWRGEDGKRRIVWESLAIAEFLADRHPEAGLWPEDAEARRMARCLATDMHCNFKALRSAMPMNIGADYAGRGRGADVSADIARLSDLWSRCRGEFGGRGPYLFGERFTAADAFFAPVAFRFETYGVELPAEDAAYAEALREHPACRKWRAEAEAEPWLEPRYFMTKA